MPGLALVAHGLLLGMGTAAEPGPGIWPGIVGLGLACCSFFLPKNYQLPNISKLFTGQAGLLLAVCILWMLLMVTAGWIIATALALLLAARGAGNGWIYSVLMPGLFCLCLGLSARLLGWALPTGWWG